MIFSYLLNMQSHPSWVCGLKRSDAVMIVAEDVSHPSWVCGLKQPRRIHALLNRSHTLRGCVD